MGRKDEQRIVHRDDDHEEEVVRVDRGERREPAARQSVEAEHDPVRADALPMSPEEVAQLLSEESLASALPRPPKLPGWHCCWLSTTNTYTPIQMYVRRGYVPVRREECPEWSFLKEHSAEHHGDTIVCNEMVLYKVPEAIYQQIMRYNHHDLPNQEAERLKANIDEMKHGDDFRDRDGKSLIQEEGDGFAQVLDRRVRAGTFE